jgi:hypothetical protein
LRTCGDIFLHIDNQALVFALIKGCSNNDIVNSVCQVIFSRSRFASRLLFYQWLSTDHNTADYPTRLDRLADITLLPGQLARIAERWQMSPSIDLFADDNNTKCAQHVWLFSAWSPQQDTIAYAFPPPAMLENFLFWIANLNIRFSCFVVFPNWAAPWLPILRRLSVDDSTSFLTVKTTDSRFQFAAALCVSSALSLPFVTKEDRLGPTDPLGTDP